MVSTPDAVVTENGKFPSMLPGAPDPLPRFMELWNSQTENSSEEELTKNALVSPPSESLRDPPIYQPDIQETNIYTIMRAY